MEASSQSSTFEETKATTAETAKLPYTTYRDYFDDSYKVTLTQYMFLIVRINSQSSRFLADS